MNHDNFKKLSQILDILDRYKQLLSVAVNGGDTPESLLRDVRSYKNLATLVGRLSKSRNDSFFFAFGDQEKGGTAGSDVVTQALQRRKTLIRAQTLLTRRRTRRMHSIASRAEMEFPGVSFESLHERLRSHVESRGLQRLFTTEVSDDNEDALERYAVSEIAASDDDSGSEQPPAIEFDEGDFPSNFISHSGEGFDPENYEGMQPQLLGHMFDKILDYLQHDLRGLIDKMKEQNGHLKQDLMSVKKKLNDAVETNDEQVQELRELTEHASELDAEARELARQLALIEGRLKRYQDQDKEFRQLLNDNEACKQENINLKERAERLEKQLNETSTTKLQDLSRGIRSLKEISSEKEEKIKVLQRQLAEKNRQVDTLHNALAQHQSSIEVTPRPESSQKIQSSNAIPDVSTYGLTANPRRRSNIQRVLATDNLGGTSTYHSITSATLAGELRDAGEPISAPIPSLAEYNEAIRQIETLRQELNMRLEEIELLRASNETTIVQIKELKEQLEQREIELKAEVEESNNARRVAEKSLETKTVELKQATDELCLSNRKQVETEEALEKKRNELLSLTETLKEEVDMKNRLENDLKLKEETLKQTNEELNNTKDAKIAVEKELENQMAEALKVKEDLQKTKSDLLSLELKLRKNVQELENLKEEREKMIQGKLEDYLNLVPMKEEFETRKDSKLMEQLEHVLNELKIAQEAKLVVEKQLEDSENEIRAIKQELQAAKEARKSAEGEISAKEDEIKLLSNKLEIAEQARLTAEEELKRKLSQLESTQEQLRDFGGGNKAVVSDLKKLRAELKAVSEELRASNVGEGLQREDIDGPPGLEVNIKRDLIKPDQLGEALKVELITAEGEGKGREELQVTRGNVSQTKRELETSSDILKGALEESEILAVEVKLIKKKLLNTQTELTEALERGKAVKEVTELKRDVERLVAELEVKGRSLAEAQEKILNSEKAREYMMKRIDDQQNDIKKLEENINAIQLVATVKDEKIKELETEIETIRKLYEDGVPADTTREDIERRRNELERLLDEERKRVREVQEVAERVQALEAEKRRVQEMSKKLQDELQDELSTLKEHLAQQEKQTRDLSLKLEHLSVEIEQQKASLTSEKEELEIRVNELQERLEEKERELSEARNAAASAGGSGSDSYKMHIENIDSMEGQRAKLAAELEKERAKYIDIEDRERKLGEECNRLRLEITHGEELLQAEKEEADRIRLAKYTEITQLIKTVRMVIEILEQQRKVLNEEKERLLESFGEQEKALRQKCEDLKKEVQQLLEANQALSADIGALKSSQKQEIEKHEERLQSVLADYRKALNDFAALSAQVENANQERQARWERAQSRIEDLQLRIDKTEKERELERSEWKNGMDKLEAQRAEVQARVIELEETNAETQSKLTMAYVNAQEADALKRKCIELAGEVEKLQGELSSSSMLEKDSLHANKMVDSMNEQSLFAQRNAQFEQHLEALKKQNGALNLKLTEARAGLECIKKRDEMLLLKQDVIMKENDRLKAKIQALLAGRNATCRDNDVTSVLEGLQGQITRLCEEIKQFKKTGAQQFKALMDAEIEKPQVFNVAYPPNVIPLVNVHEHSSSNKKSINITGILDGRLIQDQQRTAMAATGLTNMQVIPTTQYGRTLYEVPKRPVCEEKKSLFKEQCTCPCIRSPDVDAYEDVWTTKSYALDMVATPRGETKRVIRMIPHASLATPRTEKS